MNERIRKLAVKAQIYFSYDRGPGTDNELQAAEITQSDFEKFAELMVEQFDLILVNEYLDCVGENDKKSQFRVDRLRKRVKEYFGVEE
jgi:hypothetical protein